MLIKYPYLPEGRTIEYAFPSNPFMLRAREVARGQSLDRAQPTGSVLVRGDEIIGEGANGSDYHRTHECERVKRGTPTGQGYELCEGCHSKNHSERRAIEDARGKSFDIRDATLYLWGHWWCCKPCWDAMIEAGVTRVCLMKGSDVFFDRTKPGNIVGEHQFD